MILIFTMKKYGYKVFSPKNYAQKRGHIQRLRVDKDECKVTKIMTTAHSYEVIHQYPEPLVIIQ